MGQHVIKMPDIGEGIAEVELVAWHVKPGDQVVEDQPLADVMTDKANVEIPSPVVGKVISLGGEVGKLMAVGSELIRIEVEGEEKTEPRRVGFSPPPSPQAPEGGLKPTLQPAAEPAPARSVKPLDGDRPIASPAVRRRAWELGIDLGDVNPSGLGGRILQADLDAHAARMPARAEPIRALAYRLYTLCERLGKAEDARAYNELITSWTGIESAAGAASIETQSSLFDS